MLRSPAAWGATSGHDGTKIEDIFVEEAPGQTRAGAARLDAINMLRHVALVMLAFAMMAAIRQRANQTPPPKKNANDTTPPIRWSIQEVRRIAVRLA